jgi:hypothetical protein
MGNAVTIFDSLYRATELFAEMTPEDWGPIAPHGSNDIQKLALFEIHLAMAYPGLLNKYSPDQPRDAWGRWGADAVGSIIPSAGAAELGSVKDSQKSKASLKSLEGFKQFFHSTENGQHDIPAPPPTYVSPKGQNGSSAQPGVQMAARYKAVQKWVADNNFSTVPDSVVIAVAWRGSTFDPNAKIPKGSATGLLGITRRPIKELNDTYEPDTVSLDDVKNPEVNIRTGVLYMQHLLKIHPSWNMETMLDHYGTGPGKGYGASIIRAANALKRIRGIG